MEKNADMVRWTGKLEYTYTSERLKDDNDRTHKENDDAYIFRLEPSAEVNDHWSVNARLEAEGNMKHDTSSEVKLKLLSYQGRRLQNKKVQQRWQPRLGEYLVLERRL